MQVDELIDICGKLYYDGKYRDAINVCDEILRHDPDNQKAMEIKARSHFHLDEFDEALTVLNKAITLYPDNGDYLFFKSDIFMFNGEYGKAAECLEELLKNANPDEENINFIKNDYETFLSIETDHLIEREKYVDAWQCYIKNPENKEANPERSQLIREFKKYVKEYTSRVKHRQYHVKISSNEAKPGLIRFLKENGFKGSSERGLLFLIDVVDKTINPVSADEVGEGDIISESKFLDKVNYYPRDRIVHRQLHDEDGNLVYEGYTLDYSPYGFGKAYFANGELYREGIFDIKGIAQGKEYYPTGKLRFKGQWSLTRGYGPNAPCDGDAYDEKGELIFSGKFKIKRGGVGWPMIRKPKGFPLEQKQRPKINYH